MSSMHYGQIQSNNPQNVWCEINKLGPKRDTNIHMEVTVGVAVGVKHLHNEVLKTPNVLSVLQSIPELFLTW